MEMEKLQQQVVKMNCALELNRKIAGVKFLFNLDEFKSAAARQVKNKMAYCVMVKQAMTGEALKATGEDMACMGGARATGLIEHDNYSKSGQNGKALGLYRDMATAKNTVDGMSFCNHRAYGIMVKPLDEWEEEPDVVIMVTNAYNTMRIVQAYSYFYGIQTRFKMTGNQAICSESTAYPYLSNDINVSLLCIGTRHKAAWKDDELAVAFPFNRFEKISEGLMETINIMDNNEKKAIIEKKIQANHIENFAIKYNYNYYKR